MDEQLRKSVISRKLILSAAMLALPTTALAQDPNGSSVLRAQLTSGFGAGTQFGATARPSKRVAIVRPAARVLGLADPVTAPSVAVDQPLARTADSFVVEAEQSPAESIPRLPRQVRSLAELIRASKMEAPTSASVYPQILGSDVIPGSSGSIHVELAPTVRRIELGSYDPDRSAVNDPNAVVRMVNPVDASLYQRPKAKPIEVPKIPRLPRVDPERPMPIRPMPVESNDQKTDDVSAVPALMRALDDPELSELIESEPTEQVIKPVADTSRWNTFSSDRSRRLADLSGFEMLPLDQIDSE